MLGNTFGWITYGILIDDLFVFFGNAPGFLMAFWLNLQASKMQYESFRSQELRQAIVRELENNSACSAAVTAEAGVLVADDQQSETARIVGGVVAPKTVAPAPHDTLVMANVIVWLALAALIGFASNFSDRTNERIVGVSVNLNLVVFYGAPLSTIWTVLTTRSSSSIHIRTMLTNTFNGIFWSAYGIAISDLFIAVPNSLGAALGVVQILLCLLFPRKKDADDADDDHDENRVRMEMEQTNTAAEAASTTPALDLSKQPVEESNTLATEESTTRTRIEEHANGSIHP